MAIWVQIPDGFWILNTRPISKRNTKKKFVIYTIRDQYFTRTSLCNIATVTTDPSPFEKWNPTSSSTCQCKQLQVIARWSQSCKLVMEHSATWGAIRKHCRRTQRGGVNKCRKSEANFLKIEEGSLGEEVCLVLKSVL